MASGPNIKPEPGQTEIWHASAVAWGARAALIRGPSGSGKSGLALELMAYGATLISDDRVLVSLSDGVPVARAPESLSGLIEARGVGLLKAEVTEAAVVSLVVDLGADEGERLPAERTVQVLGHRVPVVQKVESPHFGPAILQYLKRGRSA